MTEKTAPAKDILPLLFEFGRLMKREVAGAGPAAPSLLHLETLRFIEETGAPAMHEVANYLRIAAPSATALVNTLVVEGFISRVADGTDRRRVRLSLTKKGSTYLESVAAKREKAFERLVAPLTPAERTQFARTLSTIIRSN